MTLLEILPYLSLATIASLVAVCAAGLLAGVAALGLRFARRGPARFWLAPAFLTLAWLPLVSGAGLSALGVLLTADAVTHAGLGSGAAAQAGLLEAQLPLLLGVLVTGCVAGLGFVLLAFGRRPASAVSRPEPPRFALLAAAVLLGLVALALGLAVPFAAQALAGAAERAVTLARVVAWSAAGFVFVLLAVAFPLAFWAPRGAAPAASRLLALGAPAALAGCSFVAAVAGGAWLQAGPAELPPVYSTPPVAFVDEPPPPPPPPVSSQPRPTGPAPVDTPPVRAAAAPPGAPVRIGGSVREPKRLHSVAPVYPPIARQARVQGIVILECVIDTEGRVASIEVLRGVPLLDEAASEAVRQWVYEPTLVNGIPVPVIMTVTVNFKLN